tara:strand:+ start:1353 stop:1688 length:336 start_codon:yes stop_codon:yes gene_type:complete
MKEVGQTGAIYIVNTTESSLVKAERMAKKLLEKKVAFCVNIFECSSFYYWEDSLNSEKEFKIIIKSDKSKLDKLLVLIKLLHSYDLPEISYWQANTTKDYHDWALKSLSSI